MIGVISGVGLLFRLPAATVERRLAYTKRRGDGFRSDESVGAQVIASVVRLLEFGCPAAVLWGIRAVVVNALNRVFVRWAPSHVGDEIIKRLPSVAHGYAASTVVLVSLVVWFPTSLAHNLPDAILRALAVAVCAVSLSRASACSLAIKASTTGGVAVPKVLADHLRLCPALTSAEPIRSFACPVRNALEDRQASYDLAGKVASFALSPSHNEAILP